MSTDKPEIPPRSAILHEAAELIDGDRNLAYGTPTQNFANIAELWNVQFKHLLKPDAKFNASHVAEAQIHVKMARSIADKKRDNWLDIAGYAGCGYETTLPVPKKPHITITPNGGTVTVGPSVGTWTGPYTTNASSSGPIALSE